MYVRIKLYNCATYISILHFDSNTLDSLRWFQRNSDFWPPSQVSLLEIRAAPALRQAVCEQESTTFACRSEVLYHTQLVLWQIHIITHTHTWMDGWMGGWMDGWMDGWVDGWVDGWMDKSTHAPTHTLDIHIKLYIRRIGDGLKSSQK